MAETEFVFAPAPQPRVPIQNDGRYFPVRRIYRVGRNYLEHIREMGSNEKGNGWQ